MNAVESKRAAQLAVFALIERIANDTKRLETLADGMNIGGVLTGCAAVLRAMDEVTVSNE